MSSQLERSTQRLEALTGLRFFAAFLILLHHSSVFNIKLAPFAYDQGVSLFFVLSGFILVHVYPELAGGKAAMRFLALRLARIWPAHALAVCVVIAAGAPIDGKLVANIALLHAWVPMGPWYFSYNAVSWSISTEFFFYLMFPLLICARRAILFKWFGALILLVVLCILATSFQIANGFLMENVVTTHGLLYINPLARLLEFVTGMVAYTAFCWLSSRVHESHKRKQGKAIELLSASILEIFAILIVYWSLTKRPLYGILYEQIGPGVWQEWAGHSDGFFAFVPLILVFALGRGICSKMLSISVLLLLGEWSYSVYVFHQIIFTKYLKQFPLTTQDPDYAGFVLCVVLTICLAAVVWRFVEIPCRTYVKNRLMFLQQDRLFVPKIQ